MSEGLPGNQSFDEQNGDNAVPEMDVEAPRREASITLREEGAGDARPASLEAAQRSLSDALRITYRLLQVLIVALVLLFLFSGFRQIEENEQAVKTRFGQVVERDIPPGFTIAFPTPLGDVRTIRSSEQTIRIDTEFYPRLRADERDRSLAELGSGNARLEPLRDGSLITGDLNQAHARWQISYRVDDATNFLQNVNPDIEQDLVRKAVESAVVRTVAGISIESLVGSSVSGLGDAGALVGEGEAANTVPIDEIERRVRDAAQQRLDNLGSGIRIASLIVVDPFPPRNVLATFRNSAREISESQRLVEEARREAERTLVQAGGPDYETILALIDRYERLEAVGDSDGAAETLDAIYAAVEGRYELEALTLGDEEFGTIAAQGNAAGEIERADAYASSIVSEAEARAETFRVKLQLMRENPRTFYAREWADAFEALFENDMMFLKTFTMPGDAASLSILLNDDPEIARDIERERNIRQTDEAIRRREEMAGVN